MREIVQTSETGFQVTLTKMAQFLIETHLVDLFLMLHDLESNLSKETRDHLFFLWKKNYREPFEEIFSANQSVLRNGISKEIAARHFFLSVSTLHHSVEKTCGRTAKCGAIDRFIFEWCIRRSVKLLYREKNS